MQRAIAILAELADARGELGTNEIARRTGINVSTISRILATLVSGGLVEHVTATGRYRLGMGVIRLANAAGERLDVRSLARPHLEDLASQVQETVTLSVPGGHEAVTLDFVQSPLSVRSVARGGPGQRRARDRGGQGLPRPRRHRPGRAAARPTPSAPSWITTCSGSRWRGSGSGAGARRWASARRISTRSPCRSWTRPAQLVAILGIQGPAVRFSPRVMRSAVELLMERAERISSAL